MTTTFQIYKKSLILTPEELTFYTGLNGKHRIKLIGLALYFSIAPASNLTLQIRSSNMIMNKNQNYGNLLVQYPFNTCASSGFLTDVIFETDLYGMMDLLIVDIATGAEPPFMTEQLLTFELVE